MIQQNDDGLSMFFLDKDISRVRVAVDVAEFKDHVRIHLTDLGRHFERIDLMLSIVFNVIDEAT